MTSKDRTWQDNAREFGALTRQGKDVRLALLVACSVEKVGSGNSHVGIPGKTTAQAFSVEALGVKNPGRVLRHLDVWNRMAEAGHVPLSANLVPSHAVTFGEVDQDVQAAFAKAFGEVTAEKPSGGRPRASAEEIAAALGSSPTLLKRVTEAMDNPTLHATAIAVQRKSTSRYLDEMDEGEKDLFDRQHKQREDNKETEYRSAVYGTAQYVLIKMALDRLAKYGHWQIITSLGEHIKQLAAMSDAELNEIKGQPLRGIDAT
jgi:hypothetical protein